MFDLTHARSFVAVAEEMHFGRAAARLNLTQSPLSRQIQMLEQTLGATLLERTTRSVRLTAAGRTFLAEAHRLLEAAASAARRTQRVAAGTAGVVTLGYTSASAYDVLPRLVARWRDALPEVELALEEMVTAEQIEALAAGRIDLGLVRPPTVETADGILLVPLMRERLLLAVQRSHALARGRRPMVEDLHAAPFVTWASRGGGYFLDLLAIAFRERGVAPSIQQRVNQTHAMLALVGAGIGLALVPESARRICPPGVILRPIRLPAAAQAELLMAWRAADDNPALPAFRALALATLAECRAA